MKVTYSMQGVMITPARMEWVANQVEQLLREAGLTKHWDDPEKGVRIFEVERMPSNAPIHGISWEEVSP